jgi:hypothetical protein
MPERAKSRASAFMAGALAVAVLPGVNAKATAAECLDNPDPQVTQPGHWYYRQDRTQNRRCWHFEPASTTANTPAAAPAEAAGEDPQQQSFFSRFATSLSQSFSPPPQPQQNSIPDSSAEATQTVSPKPAKPARTVRREQPHAAPAPTTNGAAPVERPEQMRQPAAERPDAAKNEKRDPPINVADREALFQDFVKWQLERNVFGRP